MTLEEQLDIIRKICEEDDTFPPMAYCFVRDSVHKALDNIAKAKRQNLFADDDPPDIKGADLCRFFRDTLINRFGPSAIDVLDTWNIKKTSDFGKIIYKLISVEILGKSENDSIEDFDDVFDFTEEFVMPYKQGTTPGHGLRA
ncbi:MAG: hypothetical protein IKS92_15845 [Victivallales bacterium]|nr:hypothetical protein [Victivallales bacterium]MBR4372521.1 hypothetical protein [Victivallales bacterium]MBR4417929.1 hypothetical protein [Victivallales bacterium]MBR5025124.1 hypothetical protein [Victivallales bacterium]MBR5077598.1 hypothetical protein [Victivallales bacterium]